MNSNYVAGRALEYAVKGYFERRGYYVIRAAGSHGACDLITFNTEEVIFIQCKVEGKKKNYSDDLLKLKELPRLKGSQRMLWVKRKAIIYVFDELGEMLHTMTLKELKN